jgi:hypothetical protein
MARINVIVSLQLWLCLETGWVGFPEEWKNHTISEKPKPTKIVLAKTVQKEASEAQPL